MLEVCRDVIWDCTEELKQICLHVHISNTSAIGLYQAAGFETIGTDSLLKMISGEQREYLMSRTV